MKNDKITNDNFINEAEELLREAKLIQDSVNWWEQEIEKLLTKLDEYGGQPLTSSINEKIDKVTDQLATIFSRGEMENVNMDNWIAKRNTILKKYAGRK